MEVAHSAPVKHMRQCRILYDVGSGLSDTQGECGNDHVVFPRLLARTPELYRALLRTGARAVTSATWAHVVKWVSAHVLMHMPA